ncbi:MAG: metalloregulator ArsR/SmtB family transcription factor [Cyanobacteria bacterium]|nr:metalloregulator ArsR/SmtB family transcription factor [Cyanobacteriota bacterium]
MRRTPLDPDTLEAVANRFKVLAEPARLQILNELRAKPSNVTELIAATGLNQANLSKHLQLLYTHGFVMRKRDGLFVVYALADPSVFALCDIMCAQLGRRGTELRKRAR